MPRPFHTSGPLHPAGWKGSAAAEGRQGMFYWIYEVPTLVVVALFGAFFVAFCWVGIFLFRPMSRMRCTSIKSQ